MAERIPTSALNRASGDIITRASLGESFELTRHGRTVARLLPPEEVSVRLETEYLAGQMRIASSASSGSAVTQASPHTATSPELRPVQVTEPVQAKTAQQQRDDLLRGSRKRG